jgi:hypothetical protein
MLGFRTECWTSSLFKLITIISSNAASEIQKSITPHQKYPNSCKKSLPRVLVEFFQPEIKKITCIHFFADVGFATVQGLGVVAPFFLREKVPGIPWGMLQHTSLRSIMAFGLSRRPSGLVCGHLFPSFPLRFELSFCTSFVVLKEEAVCPCFRRQR